MRRWIDRLEPRRMMDAGSLDLSFGGGKVTINAGPAVVIHHTDLDLYQSGDVLVTAAAQMATVQPSDNGRVLLWKVDADGSADTSFGTGGQQTLHMPEDTSPVYGPNVMQMQTQAVVTPDNGAIVQMGWKLLKLDENGAQDMKFGQNGVLIVTDFARRPRKDSFVARLRDIGVDSQGRIYVAGIKGDESSGTVAVERFRANGLADKSFGSGGAISVSALDRASGLKMRVLSDGRVMLAGTIPAVADLSGRQDYVAVRYKSDGTLDRRFARSGVARATVSSDDDDGQSASALKILEDGSALFALDNYTAAGEERLIQSRFVTGFSSRGTKLGKVITTTAIRDAEVLDVVYDNGQLLAALGTAAGGFPTWIGASGHVVREPTENAARSLGDGPRVTNLASGSDSTIVALGRKPGKATKPSDNSLELRRLFLNDSPAGTLEAATIRREKSSSHRFTVTWRDDDGVDVKTLGNDNVQVMLPDGTSRKAQFIGADKKANSKVITATYRLPAPRGKWDAADRGKYTVKVTRGGVRDVNGNAAGKKEIGTFDVQIPKGGTAAARNAEAAARASNE